MFTGIVKGLGTVTKLEQTSGLSSFAVHLPEGMGTKLERGASVAIDGVCLTVTARRDDIVAFDAMKETLRRTTIGQLREGSRVNCERSFHVGDEVGGHILSGHVTGTAEIVDVEQTENNHVITFKMPTEWMKYVLPKGFIGLDGCSLTIVDVNKAAGTCTVWLIPETLRLTTFGFKKAGDRVNVEIDSRTQAVVDTVESYLREHSH